jgi:WS/DGAT/MGAT family acyltransferase
VAGDVPSEALESTTSRAPRTHFNGPISPHRRVSCGQVSLDTVKAVKNAAGTTVNDVVVALCTSAVRDYLIERDDLPAVPLLAMIPVSVRTEEERGAFGNRVGTMIVEIPTNEEDPRKRLERTHASLKSAKMRHQAVPASLLTDGTAFIPPAVAALAARSTIELLSRTRPPLNLVISNVPGPREPLFCAGAQLEALYPVSAILDGVGLNMTVMSYRDHMDFGIVADRDQVDDAWGLLDRTRDALDELEYVYVGRAKRPRSKNGGKPAAKAATEA